MVLLLGFSKSGTVQFEQILLYVDGLKAFAGAVFALISVTIYWKMSQDGDFAMSEFQLHEDEVLRDAHIILYANIFGAAAMLVYTFAGLEMVPVLVGTVLRTLYVAVIIYVLAKWVRILR